MKRIILFLVSASAIFAQAVVNPYPPATHLTPSGATGPTGPTGPAGTFGNPVAVTGTKTLAGSDNYIPQEASGTFTINAPASLSGLTGNCWPIRNTGSGTITVSGNGNSILSNGSTVSSVTMVAGAAPSPSLALCVDAAGTGLTATGYGLQGATGMTGATGPTGTAGTAGATGATGPAGVGGLVNPACTFIVTNTGCTTPAAFIDVSSLNIPSANQTSIVLQCFTAAAGTQTTIAATYTFTTGSGIVQHIIPLFTAAGSSGYCTVNAGSSTGLTGATGPTGTISNQYKVWRCTIITGDPGAASAVLANDNDSPVACQNNTGVDITITAVSAWADAGSPTVTPILTGGSGTSILTGALTAGTASWAAGTVNGTVTLHSFSANDATCSVIPCTLDSNITVAGGTAKYLVVQISGTY